MKWNHLELMQLECNLMHVGVRDMQSIQIN
jgi:hypothetical protein